MNEMTIDTTTVTATETLTINDFMTKATTFLNERCMPGTAIAVSRAEVAKAGGLSEDSDALISSLITAGFMPGWRIRQGRDGGVCRVGVDLVKGPNPNKYTGDWLANLIGVLNQHVSLNTKIATPRNDIARELAKVTGEDVLSLPNKISEAISLGKCPNFESKRGSGILRKEALKAVALVVSADAETVETTEVVQASAPLTETEILEVKSMLETTSNVVELVETISDGTTVTVDVEADATNEVAAEATAEATEATAKTKSGRKPRK